MCNPFTRLREIYTQEACETPSVLELLFELEKKYDDILTEIDGKIADFEQLLVPINKKIANLELNQSGIFESLSSINADIESIANQLSSKLDKDTTNAYRLYGKGSKPDLQMMWRIDLFGNVGLSIPERNSRGSIFVPTPVEIGESANKQYVDDQILNIQNQNLLINSDFSINQRGKSVYDGTNDTYCVDRWRLFGSNVKNSQFSVSSKTLAKTAGTYAAIIQYIENSSQFLGKTITFSAKIDSEKYSVTATIPSPTSANIDASTEFTNGKIRIYFSDYSQQLRVEIQTTSSIVIDYAKLEIGNIATEYVPVIPELEMSKCQRYFQKLRINGNVSIATSTATIYTGLALPVTLRTAPTITILNQVSMREIGAGTKGNIDIAYSNLYDNILQLQASVSSLSISANAGVVWANGEITADSEIY